MSKTATIEDAKKFGACYNLDRLEAIFGKRKSLSVSQIAKLKIPAKDKVWALTRKHFLDTQTKSVKFAIFCAEQCLEHFGTYNQSDNRQRLAIEAAKKYLKSPTVENKQAAYAAAYAASNAANAANAEAYAASNAASNAAAHASNAAHAAASAAHAAAHASNAAAHASNAAHAAAHASNAAAYASNAAASAAHAAAHASNAAANAAHASNAAASAAHAAAHASNAAANAAYELQLKFIVRLLNGK